VSTPGLHIIDVEASVSVNMKVLRYQKAGIPGQNRLAFMPWPAISGRSPNRNPNFNQLQ
jgi:hypothetical protein